MVLDFYLRYSTKFGQQIFIVSEHLSKSSAGSHGRIAMRYHDQDYWQVQIELPDSYDDNISYYYSVKNDDGLEVFEGEESRYIDLTGKKHNQHYSIIDTWNEAGNLNNPFFSKAFSKVLLPPISHTKHPMPKQYTHEFRVKAPLLEPYETICLCGSTRNLMNWDRENPILLTPKNNWFYTRIAFEENEWPASYKYGIYNLKEKKLVSFEEGENRMLRSWEVHDGITLLHDGFLNYQRPLWRGTGVNIPVFSLRSRKSFGVGEFPDLKLLIEWAKQTGIELIQLLPVNDTSAQNNWHDSYPYAAISSFALHPLYINLDKVADKRGADIIKSLRKKQRQLNALPQVDYEQAMKFKKSALRELYNLQKDSLKEDVRYFEFFEVNRHWLVPYAAFSYLKEKYKTTDFNQWKKYAVYDEAAIQKLSAPHQKHYNEIAFHYFVQFHLHLQLSEIAEYAHKQKIILKGDIPIGIYRYSCDAWVNPTLYNMDAQAGAPPDDFASTGQNWGFPTYNWNKMKEDDFKWWRTRFDQLSNYFDVFRIDHILGFFRIWSIPVEALEGIMGRFDPALPVHRSEFDQRNISFDHDRYCKPYIDDEIISELFGEDASIIMADFLEPVEEGLYRLKSFVSNQRDALEYLSENDLLKFKDGIFQLISNVILFEVEGSNERQFHFRISVDKTFSFQKLDEITRTRLMELYYDYYYHRQDYFWKKQAMQKLPQLKRSTRMLVCGEDLGMVPHCVPEVMRELGIISLEVQRMPKQHGKAFFHPSDAHYLSVVTPSTHDTSTLREWWNENPETTQKFYNTMLGHYGEAPAICEPQVVKEIITQHLYSPAMWAIFLIQDLLAMNESFRPDDPKADRINVPSDPNHYWRYRMAIPLETLIKSKEYNQELREQIKQSGRLQQKSQ